MINQYITARINIKKHLKHQLTYKACCHACFQAALNLCIILSVSLLQESAIDIETYSRLVWILSTPFQKNDVTKTSAFEQASGNTKLIEIGPR